MRPEDKQSAGPAPIASEALVGASYPSEALRAWQKRHPRLIPRTRPLFDSSFSGWTLQVDVASNNKSEA